MRHWLVRPDLMCSLHKSGEHLECHMFNGSMRGNISLLGYYDGGLFFGPTFLKYRHDELAGFFTKPHLSTMTWESVLDASKDWEWLRSRQVYEDVIPTEEQIKASRTTLLERCGACRSLHLGAKREGHPFKYSVDSSRLLHIGSVADTATESES